MSRNRNTSRSEVEAFWRSHLDGWAASSLNQREYCEAHGLPLKRFGNWRAKFKAEPEEPVRKLLYRRGGISHTPSHRHSHTFGHTLSHVTYPSSVLDEAPVVPPVRGGHRRRFTDAQRAHILAEAARPGVSVSEVARRYGIARRVLCRWRQEEQVRFIDVEIVDEEALS